MRYIIFVVRKKISDSLHKAYIQLVIFCISGVPQLYLTINGQNASNEYYVKLGENLIVTCLAVGGTPPAELLFIERTRDVSDLMPKETPPTISFRMTKDFPEPEDLTCNSIQHLHETEWKTTLVVTLKIIGKINWPISVT